MKSSCRMTADTQMGGSPGRSTIRRLGHSVGCCGWPARVPVLGIPVPSTVLVISGKSVIEVFDQVIRVLQANGEPEKAFWRPRCGPLHRGPMLNQAFGAPKTGGARKQLASAGNCQSLRTSPMHLERRHSAKQPHLSCRDIVTGM